MTTIEPTPPAKSTIVPKPWQNGLGPYYIGLFLWVVFFDQLGLRALPVGGLLWSVLGAVVAGPLCYLLLFRVPASWGQATGKTLPELGESTFGEGGARWVPGLLLGLAEVAWFAVAVSYATDLTLRGLAEVRFLDGRAFRPITLGGLRLKSPLFLATALFWGVFTGLIGRKFVRLVAAIMYVFPVFPAILLGGVMFAMLGGLRTFVPSGIDPAGLPVSESQAGLRSMMLVAQMILGFFAMAGAMGADWGAASTSPRDVKVGGWVAAGFAPVIIATIALVAVAGFLGRANPAPVDLGAEPDPITAAVGRIRAPASTIQTLGTPAEATFRALMTDGVGGKVGAAMLIIFGAIALAPAVFSAYVFGIRLNASLPALSRFKWTLVGIALAWPIVALGLVDRLEVVFTAMGALFAPLVGCMAAESSRHKEAWPGPRRGVNLPGFVGWVAGVAVGLLPFAGGRFRAFLPATFWAFVAGFLAYSIAALLLGEAKPISRDAGDSNLPNPPSVEGVQGLVRDDEMK